MSQVEMKTLHFSIQGEFITNMARERYYQDNNLKGAMELLLSATETDQISYEERLGICLQILDGKAKIKGTYPGDDYGLEETKDEPSLGFLEHITKITEKLKAKEEELDITYRKICYIMDYLADELGVSDYRLARIDSAYYREYGEHFFEKRYTDHLMREKPYAYYKDDEDDDSISNPLLQSYLDRRNAEKEYNYDPDEDYGWLAPDGTYYPVPWGDHSKWAMDYCNEHYPFKENASMYWKTDADGKRHHYVNGDFLVYVLHWVLLDSPHQGIATPKYDPAFPMTKAQKEFLYQYYIDRGQNDKANAIWNDD